MRQKSIDQTEGVIWKSLILFFLPILGGSLLQQLYVTADALAYVRIMFAGLSASTVYNIGAGMLRAVGDLRRVRFLRAPLAALFALGLPMALQSMLYPVANMTVQSSINATGTDNIAAWALCGKPDFLIWLVADSPGVAISTFSAQNYGARKPERLNRGVITGTAMTLAIVAVISAGLFAWSGPLSRLFLRDAAVIARTREIIALFALY